MYTHHILKPLFLMKANASILVCHRGSTNKGGEGKEEREGRRKK